MAQDDGNFFSRWSRRKEAARSGQALPPEPVVARAAPVAAPAPVVAPAPLAAPEPPAAREPAPPAPTLDDVARLTPESDFSRFVAKDVSSDVRNAAVKKLFADPHFNVMDGLDIYIDDYSKPSPLSKAELAMMVGAKFLKLVDDPDEKKAEAPAAPTAPTDGGPTAATPSPPEGNPTPSHDDHADLQLQPDHAPGPQGPGRGTG
ncbi:DUF3306 domain-containing protein [Hydrogenophaga sp. T2]|uniref:DUF3306 domain-containing protein n=1 Tax=Hydrogenophaga sp. T2 TaxID=3132823 RepID=UPI003CF0456F